MVAFVASATDTNTNGVDETSITITKPTGTLDGHLMVAVVAGYNPVTLTAPSGWVLMYGPQADSTGLYSWVFQKIAASEGANYTWTWSGAGGALNGSISTFSDAAGIDTLSVNTTSTTDPAGVTSIQISRESLGYAVYCWRDTTANTCSAVGGTGVSEKFDVQAKDVGTIVRGQAGYTHTVTETYVTTSSMFSIDPTNSVTHGIMWSMSIGDGVVSNESWASSGFAVELDLNGTQTDVTSYVRAESGIQIKRGSSSESNAFEPSQLSMTLDNTDGRFSPRNPTGAYYGTIGRNTPVRVSKAHGTVGLQLQGERGDYIRTIGNDAVDITSDIDIRIDLEPKTWHQAQTLASKLGDRFLTESWIFFLDEEGFLNLRWSNDGVTTVATVTSTLPVPQEIRQAVRVTLDVNNGAAGNTATFYYADTISDSWTQLGDAVVTAGTTSIYSYPSPIIIGETRSTIDFGQFAPTLHGTVYHFELRSGIAGSLVSDVDFTTKTTGSYSFTENSNLWICYGNAVISNRHYRFHGEISEWPARWDSTGNNVYVPVEGAGISRRLQRGSDPLKSAMYRFRTSTLSDIDSALPDTNSASPIAYWPMEDAAGSSVIASALPTGKTMKYVGTPTFATYEGFKASAPLIQMKTGVTANGRVTGASTDGFWIDFLISAPSGITNNAYILAALTTGSVASVALSYPSADNLRIRGFDDDYGTVFDSGSFGVSLVGELVHITVLVYQNGSAVDWAVYSQEVTAAGTSPTLETSGSTASQTIGSIHDVQVGTYGLLNDVYLGHIAVYDVDGLSTGVFDNPLAINAYSGEDAATRIKRLCREEDIEFRHIGNTRSQADLTEFFSGDGIAMGYQTITTFFDLLEEVRSADGGFVYEPRDIAGIGYRTLDSLYSIPAKLTLDYSAFDLSGDLWPTEDDQKLVNVMTITRKDASSYIFEKSSGALSTEDPPNGVGRYSDSDSVSLETDALAADVASWRVHLGTVDEARYPSVQLALENPRFVASSSKTQSLLTLDIGDRIDIQNPPSWIPPQDISLIVVGYTETFDKFQHYFTLVCVPASPYVNVGFTDLDTSGRVDTDASSLSASATSSATSLTVATTGSDYVWIDSATYSSDFPFDIMVGGEQMTVTALTSTSSPQTFTVTRSVNGVTKTHAVGTEVHVFQPVYVGL